MNCKNCGNKIPDNANFCDKCGTPQNKLAENMNFSAAAAANTTFQQKLIHVMRKKDTKLLIVIAALIIIIIALSLHGKSSDKSINNNNDDYNQIITTEAPVTTTESSKYTKSNSYGIPCNGNNDLAIEAANVFANKYGGPGHDWVLKSVDASVSGMKGTYRYKYTWAGNSYVSTTDFEITDYGSYRNYSWSGDFVDLFYGW